MMRLQWVAASQQPDYILSGLAGEARQEVLLVDAIARTTGTQVLDIFKALYGDRAAVATLRVRFFSCKQKQDETVGAFSLRLREEFARLQRRGSEGPGWQDTVLRDQFLLGLKEGHIQQELQRQIRHNPTKLVKAVLQEARILEEEVVRRHTDGVSCALREVPCSQLRRDLDKWKQEFWAEPLQEITGQVTQLTKNITEEI